jgi:hypothetical protein
VQAYDRAVSLAKEEVARRMGLGKESVSGNDSTIPKKPRKKKRQNKDVRNFRHTRYKILTVYLIDWHSKIF